MARTVSAETRHDLLQAIRERYGVGTKDERFRQPTPPLMLLIRIRLHEAVDSGLGRPARAEGLGHHGMRLHRQQQGDGAIECRQPSAALRREAEQIHIRQLSMASDERRLEHRVVRRADGVTPEVVMSARAASREPLEDCGH
jgi:hypothetical protein